MSENNDLNSQPTTNTDDSESKIEIVNGTADSSKNIEEQKKGLSKYYSKLQSKYMAWKDQVIQKTSKEAEEDEIYGKDWDQMGYQRTIAGFLYTFGLLIPQAIFGIFMVPLLKYTELRYVEVSGIETVANVLFGAVYVILDLNLEASVNRFVPQYAISNPKKAMQYVSFFVKYQMWSGLFQITFVSMFIMYYLIPHGSQFTYVAWYMIFICVKQYPATLGTFKGIIDSLQHINKGNLIVFYRASLIEPLTKLAGGVIGLYYGYANPVWGPMMGMTIGIAIGGYVDDFFTFALGTFWLSKILDNYNIKIRDIYADKVPKDVWKSALWFAARFMPQTLYGAILGWTGAMISVEYLPGYTTYRALTSRASDLAKFITWSDDIINASQPVYSESLNNGKVQLTKFYIAQGLKYNNWMLMILGSFNILALPAIFDIAIPMFLPEEWRPITRMVPIYVMLFLYKPYNDIADKLTFLSGHPEVNTAIGIMQTTGNLFFTWFFLVHLQMGWLGLILISVPMDLLGFIIRWLYMSKKVVKLDKAFWKDIAWQVYIAPILSGGIMGVLIVVILYIVYPIAKKPFESMDLLGIQGGGILIPGVILILVLLLCVILVYFPLYSYFGGWDERTLNVFRKCVPLTGPSLWLIYPMFKIFRHGFERMPEWVKKKAYIKLGDIAQEELRDLAIMRKNNLAGYKAAKTKNKY